MDVRDATADDAAAIAALVGGGERAARRLVRDRAVSVAEDDGEVVGVVAFEATDDAVHVTRIAGPDAAVAALVGVPRSFATTEGLPIEALVPADETGTAAALSEAGFADVGEGPRFDGDATRRFRRESE